MIKCRYEGLDGRQGAVVQLTGGPTVIERTDLIATDHGAGTIVEGSLVEDGKIIMLKIQTGGQHRDGQSNIKTEFHYIDSGLLPRKIPVEGVLLKGSVIVEKN